MRIQRGVGALLSGTVIFVAAPSAIQAQTSSNSKAVGSAEEQSDRFADFGEIVVTAQKREQNLNDVGLSITALPGQLLKDEQILTSADLANKIPSLSFTYTPLGGAALTLRGVGVYEPSLAAYQAVALYVDEVPLPFQPMTAHANLDLERVEVLKGPQGTLFGQNSTGGAINFIAAKPTEQLSAGFDLGYGRFNSVTAEGFVSGPLSDAVKARLAGRIERADGWQVSASRPDDRNGRRENYIARLIVDLEPSDGAKIQININGWKDKSDTQAAQLIGLIWQNPIHPPIVENTPFTRENPRAADWLPGIPFGDNRQWQASVRGDLDLTDGITLTSITSYVDYKHHQGISSSGGPFSITDTRNHLGRVKSFAQELRVANSTSATVRWMLGGNFETSKVNEIQSNYFPDISLNPTYGAIGFPIMSSYNINNQKMKNYAAFANLEYDPSPQLTLRAGARYTKADRKVYTCLGDISGRQDDLGALLYLFSELFSGQDLPPYQPGACAALNNLGTPPTFAPGDFRGKLNEDNVSWRVGADWKPGDDILLYANVSKGYKAGSFPVLPATGQSQYLPARQESVLAFEAGFKASLADRMVQINGAAFYYDYTDKQLRAKLIDPLFGLVEALQNIPKSSVKGGEVEVQVYPVRGLSLRANLTYLDAKVDEFNGVNTVGVIDDFSGTRLPYTPKWQGSVGADYEMPVSNSLTAFVGGTVNYRSDTTSIIGGDLPVPGAISPYAIPFRIRSYTLVDARAGIKSADGAWRFQLWGKNIFNKYYYNNVTQVYDVTIRYTGMPATYGATIGYRF